MNNLYDQKSKNIRKTWLLMSLFLLAFIAFGAILSAMFKAPIIMYVFGAFALVSNVVSYFFSDKIALSQSGAKPASKEEYPELHAMVETLARRAEIPTPRLYIIDEAMPNAFATGRNPQNGAVAVTKGILPLLNKSELEGVIAHELAHIANRDTLIMTIVSVLAGLISLASNFLAFGGSQNGEDRNPLLIVVAIAASIIAPFAAMIVQLSISRRREFLADASGALLTRYPQGLASALQKISQFTQPMKHANPSSAHMYIANPLGHSFSANGQEKVGWMTKLFMTHPPTQERVDALLGKNR